MGHSKSPTPIEHFEEWVTTNNYQTETSLWLMKLYSRVFPGRVAALLAALLDRSDKKEMQQ